jgi:hypothetical protein
VVSEAMDETEYLLKSPANKKRLLKSIKDMEKGRNIKTFTAKEFEQLNKELLNKKKP